jgi:hypothetical protein
MLDFRIIVAAIIVCVSLVMVGTRVLSTSDAFNISAGSRPGVRTMSDPVRPSIALSPASPSPVDLPAPQQPSIVMRPVSPKTPAIPATANPQPKIEAASANSSANDITGSIPRRSETADAPTRRSTVAAPHPPVQPNQTVTAPVSELTGSIFSHPEAQPNVEPDWKQNPPRRSAVAPAPTPTRPTENPGNPFGFLFNSVTR